MTTVTTKGRNLALDLMRVGDYGTNIQIRETCSLICRHATTYASIQEALCTIDMSDHPGMQERYEQRDEDLMRLIARHVERLPETDEGPWKVQFDGDPRGYTVRLIHPNGREVGVA